MGQALRSTTTVRRPVDMFFLPSDESDGIEDSAEPTVAGTESASKDPAGLAEERPEHDVSRETLKTSRHHVSPGSGSITVDDTSEKGPQSANAAPDSLESTGIDGAADSQPRTRQQSPQTISSPKSPDTTEPDASVPRETSTGTGDGTNIGLDASQLDVVPGAEFAEIPVADIHPNRKQPRQVFDEDELAELAFSVKELGVLQPVVVRPSREGEGAKYELVMGERRWRAVQKAGIDSVPAIIRETSDDDLLRDALLENLHRSQLNPLEEAAAYQQLLEEFGATQDELSRRIGRSRPQISNTLRLLRLPPLVQRRVAAGVLSSGHARALLGLTDPAEMERLAQRVVAEGMSVRATEETVALSDGLKRHAPKRKSATHRHDDRLNYIADAFSDRLDTSVKIQLGARKGKMTIEFASVEDLNRIIDVLDPKVGGQS